jgi:hypothetical protein
MRPLVEADGDRMELEKGRAVAREALRVYCAGTYLPPMDPSSGGYLCTAAEVGRRSPPTARWLHSPASYRDIR